LTKWHWDRFYPELRRFSPVNFTPPVLHYTEKRQKTDHHHHHHHHHRAAHEASRLREFRSICCRALNHKKKFEWSILCSFCQTFSTLLLPNIHFKGQNGLNSTPNINLVMQTHNMPLKHNNSAKYRIVVWWNVSNGDQLMQKQLGGGHTVSNHK
jgi:hypothetical protein